MIIDPVDVHFWEVEFAPTIDTCERDYESPVDLDPLANVHAPDAALFGNGEKNIEAYLTDTPSWLNDDVAPTLVQLDSVYSLAPLSTGVYPALTINSGIETPHSLVLQSPDLESELQELGRDELRFAWTGAEEADRILFRLAYYETTAEEYTEIVTCQVTNDGNFQVPSTAFSSFGRNDYVLVWMTAAVESTAVIPFNDSDFRMVGAHTRVAGFLALRD